MGCVRSRPVAVGPGPAATTALQARGRGRRFCPWGVFAFARTRGKRFTREQRQLIKKYLPSIPIFELSTPAHREVAGAHWGEVYREASMSTTSKRSQGSGSRAEIKATSSVLRDLYDTFYAFLEQHAPDLMPVFRASLHVRGKVLVHISAGMPSILASPDALHKIAQLTQTHLRVGVQLEHFDPLARALLFAMERTSGACWTPEVEDAWRRLFAHCAALLLVEQKRAAQHALKSAKSAKSASSLAPPPSAKGDIFRPPMGTSIREQSSSAMPSGH